MLRSALRRQVMQTHVARARVLRPASRRKLLLKIRPAQLQLLRLRAGRFACPALRLQQLQPLRPDPRYRPGLRPLLNVALTILRLTNG